MISRIKKAGGGVSEKRFFAKWLVSKKVNLFIKQ